MNSSNLGKIKVSHPEKVSKPWTLQRGQIWFSLLAIFGLFVWSISRVDLSVGGIVEIFEGWPETRNLLSRMVPPFIPSEDFTVITKAALDTFFIAFAGTALGIVLGVPLGLLSARNLMPFAPIRSLARAIIVFSRATLGWVGAGGIGLILRGYAGSLRYQEMLGITILIVVLVILLEILSAITRHALLGKTETKLPGKPSKFLDLFFGDQARPGKKVADWMISKSSNEPKLKTCNHADRTLTPPWTRERVKVNSVGLIFFILLIFSIVIPDIAASKIVNGSQKLPSFIARLTPNDWSWFTDRIFSDMVDTIAIGLAATGIALLFAVPFSFLAASNTAPGRLVYLISRFFMLLVRCVPELVVAVVFVAAIGPGPKTGTLALAIGMFGFITKLFADSIEEARQGIRDGVNSTGANRLQESVTGVLPQVAPSMVSNSLYLLDVAIRSSTILGIVGGGGIGFLLMSAAKRLYFETLGGIIFCIFVYLRCCLSSGNYCYVDKTKNYLKVIEPMPTKDNSQVTPLSYLLLKECRYAIQHLSNSKHYIW